MNERISATLTFSCGGCDAVERVEAIRLGTNADYKPISPAISRRETRFFRLDFRDHTPEGWMASDPYTRCTYCPDCWASIEAGVDEDASANKPSRESGPKQTTTKCGQQLIRSDRGEA